MAKRTALTTKEKKLFDDLTSGEVKNFSLDEVGDRLYICAELEDGLLLPLFARLDQDETDEVIDLLEEGEGEEGEEGEEGDEESGAKRPKRSRLWTP